MAGLRTYFDKHAWGNTTLADLLAELETTSGRDLSAWSKEWLRDRGLNTLRPSFELDGDGAYTPFAVAQEAPADHPDAALAPDRDRPATTAGRRAWSVVAGSRSTSSGRVTEVPALVGETQPDLLLLNDDDLTFAKIRLDERSLATLTSSLGELDDSLARALCWSAAWDMTRDAEMRGARLRPARLQRRRRRDRHHHRAVGAAAGLVRGRPVRRPWAPGPGQDRAGRAMRDLALAAEPGSDHQLALVRAFAGVAADPADLELLGGLLDGTTDLPGLDIDTDLRWALLRRLVSTGVRSDDAIDAELARDNTASGQRHAATARASRPTAAAKDEAWAAVVETDDLPNALQTATIAGFQDPDHRDLLEPFVDRYFASVGPVWDTRTSEMAANIVIGLYPALIVDPGVAAKTDAYLDTEHPAAPLARLLAEGRDGIQRALRCQARDAG